MICQRKDNEFTMATWSHEPSSMLREAARNFSKKASMPKSKKRTRKMPKSSKWQPILAFNVVVSGVLEQLEPSKRCFAWEKTIEPWEDRTSGET